MYCSVWASAGLGVHTLQIASMRSVTGAPPCTRRWVLGGQRSTGVAGPTCTGIEITAERPPSSGSPSITSSVTEAGPT